MCMYWIHGGVKLKYLVEEDVQPVYEYYLRRGSHSAFELGSAQPSQGYAVVEACTLARPKLAF